MDGFENEASEVRKNFICLLSALAVPPISFGTPALCVGTGMRGWRVWGEGTAWSLLLGFIPKLSLSEIPPSKITWKAQECIKIFPPGSSTPLMAFPSAEFPRIEGLCCAQAEVSVAKEKDTFLWNYTN